MDMSLIWIVFVLAVMATFGPLFAWLIAHDLGYDKGYTQGTVGRKGK